MKRLRFCMDSSYDSLGIVTPNPVFGWMKERITSVRKKQTRLTQSTVLNPPGSFWYQRFNFGAAR